MGACDIIVLVVICSAVAAVIGWLIYKKVKGKGGCCDCGGSCSSCSACSRCNPKQNEK